MKEESNIQGLFIWYVLTILTYCLGVCEYCVISMWLSLKVFLKIHHMFLIPWFLLLFLHQMEELPVYNSSPPS
ncbi:hypothetical protein XELAEV_18016331mg [Xenopus laevis]|uniref:Uncharacterized protein n=1 Tax=Xenopus laevis TaxID=8355 RepID=A0A974DKU6_XENLA|nr:hypothetical protein XELAEV_18016331mg [Xenopus laevis]